MKVHILDRQTLNELSSFGEGGRQPGEFFAVHSIATDSKGNVYTVETLEGKAPAEVRLQGRDERAAQSGHYLVQGRQVMRARDTKFLVVLSAVTVAIAIGWAALHGATPEEQTVQAPRFEVDPMWPKPLPNHWVLGNVIGVGVDANDHVFIVHRVDTVLPGTEDGASGASPISECCVAAPPVIEFDPEGNVVKAWGGPVAGAPYVWPSSNHGISIDDKDNVWIGGNGGGDSHILKFTHDGKFLMQIGTPGQATDSKSLTHFGRVAKISFDIPAQRGVRRRRLRQQARRRARHEHRRDQAVLGRVRQRAVGHELRRLQPRLGADPAVPDSRALRRADEGRVRCTCATGRTIAFRSSRRPASS